MNIKTVSQKTGLTKKAIKYYESEGLISPSKNAENNYREYADEDITKLNLIAALRAVDIPICEIKHVIHGEKALPEVMKDTLSKINETINSLEKSRIIISNIIEKDLKDYESIGEKVKKFRETLEFSMCDKKELISDTILRIFPGSFGEMIVSSYKPFLNISIDSDEKKDAWLKFVEFLDNLDELNKDHPFIIKMKNANMDSIKKFEEKTMFNVMKLLNGDKTVKEQYKNIILNFVKSVCKNDEARKIYKENLTAAKDMMGDIGAGDNTFDEYLEVLNDDYRRYRQIGGEIRKEVDEELKREFGFGMEELLGNL